MSLSHLSAPLARRPRAGAESPGICAAHRVMVRLAPLCLYHIRDPPEEGFGRRQRDIHDGLPPKLPKRADAEHRVLGRERGEAIAHERHTLEVGRRFRLMQNSRSPAGTRAAAYDLEDSFPSNK